MDRFVAMKVFVSVAELGSLAAAANKLDMSRAMATRHLAFLEKVLGARLLHRTSRSLGLTQAGNDTLPYCRQILALADDIESTTAGSTTEPAGPVRVACSVSFGQSYLAGALLRYAALHPKVAVEMILSDRAFRLVEERIDLAIQLGQPQEPGLVARLLTDCQSVVCAAPGYLARRGTPVTPQQLSRHNCMVHTRHGSVWRFSKPTDRSGRAEAEEISVSGDFSANDTMVLLEAALAGRGIVHLPAFSATPQLRSGALVQLMGEYRLPTLGIHALFASRKHLPATTRSLLDFLLEDLARGK